ncbi:MAG: transposase [Verrucomicrobiaceae bacterium]|nr:transposase [Verrucomicrobiaceae bacterium]
MSRRWHHHRAGQASAHGKRTYDEHFKCDAVAFLKSGRKAAQFARELGISPCNPRDWKERYSNGDRLPAP